MSDNEGMIAIYNSVKDKIENNDKELLERKCKEQLRFFRNCEKVIDSIKDEKRQMELKTATGVCLKYSASFNTWKSAFLQFYDDVSKKKIDFYTALDRMELQIQLLMDNVSGYNGSGEVDDRHNLIRERKMRLKHSMGFKQRN